MLYLFIGQLRQQVGDAVEPGLLLVHGLHQPPGRLGDVGALQHGFLGLGVVLPAAAALEVHGTELPLLERVVHAAQKAQVLLLVGDGEPVLHQRDARAHQHLLELGHGAEELLVLLVGAKAHHALHAGAVVPAAVKENDLAARRQVGDIALEIPLRALAVVGRGQGGHAAHARVQALGDALDHAALAGRIAALEEDDHLFPVVLHPVLQLDQLALQAQQLAEVGLAAHGVGTVQIVATAAQAGVVYLHLQFFVVAVEQIAFDALHQRIMVVGQKFVVHGGESGRPGVGAWDGGVDV